MDPMSFDCLSNVEDWITGKDVLLEDYGSSDWMALDPPSANTMLLGHSNDDVEELTAGNYNSLDVKLLQKMLCTLLNLVFVLAKTQGLMMTRFSTELKRRKILTTMHKPMITMKGTVDDCRLLHSEQRNIGKLIDWKV